MADTVFYSTENHHNERELTIVNVAMLVGKAPTKEKRIRIKVRMLLSETINMGSPEFLDHAHRYVAQNHDVVSPKVEFRGYDLHFSADNLFEAQGVKSPRCQMRSFEVAECGDSENPDVAATFTIYMPFSTASWEWLGAFGGETCWCSFTPGVPDATPEGPNDQLSLTSGDDEEDEDDSEIDEDEVEEIDEDGELDTDNETGNDDVADVVLEDALHVFENHGKVSAVELQRVLSISYARAAHIIDKMEAKRMVSKADESGVRTLRTPGKEHQKSSPKDLAAYHEQTLDAEPARKRGRPRKITVDPLTVDEATAF